MIENSFAEQKDYYPQSDNLFAEQAKYNLDSVENNDVDDQLMSDQYSDASFKTCRESSCTEYMSALDQYEEFKGPRFLVGEEEEKKGFESHSQTKMKSESDDDWPDDEFVDINDQIMHINLEIEADRRK